MSTLSKILKLPLILLVVVAFFASIYAAHNEIQGITYAATVILGIFLVVFMIGVVLELRAEREHPKDAKYELATNEAEVLATATEGENENERPKPINRRPEHRTFGQVRRT